jgi:hypothetical protein
MLKGLKRRLAGRPEEDLLRAERRMRITEPGSDSGGSEAVEPTGTDAAQTTETCLEGYGLKVLFTPIEPEATVAE